MEFANLNSALKGFADFTASQMKINLGAKVTRKIYRSKWKNGKPYNTRVKTIRANHDASGSLINSINVVKQKRGYGISMNSYATYVEYGRQKGKGVSPKELSKWINNKNLKPRNLVTGQFLKNNTKNKKAMAFMMNRKIKNFGIEPFPFIDMSFESADYKFKNAITEAMAKDIYKNLDLILIKKR